MKRLSIDLSEKQSTPVVYAVQGEKNSRKIRFDLFNGGVQWGIDRNASVLISYKKADGHGGMYDVLDSGESAFEFVENSTNSVIITLAKQVLTTVGNVPLMVSFMVGDKILSTFSITLDVSENPGIDVAESEDYFSLSAAIDAAKRAAEEIIQRETFASQDYVNEAVERLRVSVDAELETISEDAKTFYVQIHQDGEELTANHTVNSIIGAYESGRTVKAIVSIDGEDISVPLVGIVEENTAFFAGYGVYGNYVVISQTDSKISLIVREFITQDHIDRITAEEVGAIPSPVTANVGETIVVSKVDENGKPTEWMTAQIGSGGGGTGNGNAVLFIPQNLTPDQKEQARNNIGVSDKQEIEVVLNDVGASLVDASVKTVFDSIDAGNTVVLYRNIEDGTRVYYQLRERKEDAGGGESLTFTYRSTVVIDDIILHRGGFFNGSIGHGTENLTADTVGAVPAPMTAKIGQAMCVTEVDEDGKPVEWGAADLAGGGLKETVIFDITTTEPVNEFQIYVDDAEKIALLNSATMVCWRMTLVGDETATDTTGTGTAQLHFCGIPLLPSTSCVPSVENKGWFVGNANGFILRSGLTSSLGIQSPNANKANTWSLDLVISMANNNAPKFYTATLLAYKVTGGRNDALKLTTSLPIGTGSRIIVTAISE